MVVAQQNTVDLVAALLKLKEKKPFNVGYSQCPMNMNLIQFKIDKTLLCLLFFLNRIYNAYEIKYLTKRNLCCFIIT